MTFFLRYVFIVTILSIPQAWSFQIDTLSRVINNDTEYLEITGDNEREYIYTQLTQVFTNKKDGFREELLNPEFISSWPVIVEPGEIVLDKYDKIRIKITRNVQQQDEDTIVGLSFIPDNVSRKLNKDSGLNISIGYKAWLFIPGKSPLRGQVTAFKNNGKLVINNMTNKILRIVLDGCKKDVRQQCNGSVISLPTTTKEIDVTENIRLLDIYLINDIQKKVRTITL